MKKAEKENKKIKKLKKEIKEMSDDDLNKVAGGGFRGPKELCLNARTDPGKDCTDYDALD